MEKKFTWRIFEIRGRLEKREQIKAQRQTEQAFMGTIEQQALDNLSDDELQGEIDGLVDVIKDLKKEQSKRKRNTQK